MECPLRAECFFFSFLFPPGWQQVKSRRQRRRRPRFDGGGKGGRKYVGRIFFYYYELHRAQIFDVVRLKGLSHRFGHDRTGLSGARARALCPPSSTTRRRGAAPSSFVLCNS